MRLRCSIVFLFLIVAFAPAREIDPPHGWLLHLPGIGGHLTIDDLLTRGLRDGGINSKIEIYDWTGTDRGIASLTMSDRHREQSAVVEKMIENHFRANPSEPITITAHSAGTGIAIWALEQLPDDVQIEDLVMIASALSPKYDLSKAFRHVRHKIYAFNSEADVLVLGIGTRTFGTVDGVKTDAGGRVGFKMPAHGDAEQYAKLQQIPYESDWVRFNNSGEHIGPMMRSFSSHVIARVLLGKGLPPHATTRSTSKPTSQPTTDR